MKNGYQTIEIWLEQKKIFVYSEIFKFYESIGVTPTSKIKSLVKKTLESCRVKRYGKYYVFISILSKM